MGQLQWNIGFMLLTHYIICWCVKVQDNNKLYSEQFTRVLYSIVIHPCKVSISC